MHSTLSAFMKDVLAGALSRRKIAKTFRRSSTALEALYTEAIECIRGESVLNIDETDHREKGKRVWTRMFRVINVAVFQID